MKLSSKGTEIKLFLPPYPYRAAAVISFDYETSAQTPKPGISAKARTFYRKYFRNNGGDVMDLSSGYGRGYGNRAGAGIIKKIFRDSGINGTWFSTGHALLKGNKSGNLYRINQKLDYASPEYGFGFLEWRKNLESFYHEPFGDFKSHPYYYLGDLTKSLFEEGEDIQSHSFSHPYIPLESAGNLKTDLEDWQSVSAREGFGTAEIFAFPYLGDYYCVSKETDSPMLPSQCRKDKKYDEVFLGSEASEIFKECGFRVFTRCMSKSKEKPADDFQDYNGTGIYYIASKGFLSFENSKKDFKEYIDGIIENHSIVDLWLHPNDILDTGRLEFFISGTGFLAEKRNSGELWLTTMKKLWERKKLLSSLSLDCCGDSMFLQNNSSEDIDDVLINPLSGAALKNTEEGVKKSDNFGYRLSIKSGQRIRIGTETNQ